MANSRVNRRDLTIGALATTVFTGTVASGRPVRAGSGTPAPSTPGPLVGTPVGTPIATAPGWLVAADNGSAQLHILSLSDLALVVSLGGVTINDHAGFLPLTGGQLLFVDTTANALALLDLAAEGGPTVTQRVPVPAEVSHIAVDPELRYVAVGSSDPAQTITLISLDDFSITALAPEAGEVGLALGSEPLTIFHRNDVTSQFETILIEDALAGDPRLSSTVPTGAFGHGEAISHTLAKIVTLSDDGVDIVSFSGADLTFEQTVPWDTDGLAGARGYFCRLNADQTRLISYIANRAEGQPWAEWPNDFYSIDLETGEVLRAPLAPGYVYRFAMGPERGLFFHLNPAGDHALIVDVDPASDGFGQTVATIPLPALANAAPADGEPWDGEARVTAMTPDGTTGFITQGGEGVIHVIDMASGQLTGQISTPSSLTAGGYLIAIQPDAGLIDTIGR